MVRRKPKFMYRPSEFGEWFAKLGRLLKANKRVGLDNPIIKERHRATGKLIREGNTFGHHGDWWKCTSSKNPGLQAA